MSNISMPKNHLYEMVKVLLVFVSFPTTTFTMAFSIPDPIIHFSVGAVAGGAGAIAAYPFDYIKSQMQTEMGSQKYKNGLDAFVDTVQSGNPLQLYKGVGVQVLGIAPEKGIKLGVNDVLASTFYSSMGCFPLWGQVLSGGVAGACQVIASSPLEVMKVGLQTSDMNVQQVWQKVGGVPGLFRGAEACILRDVLFTAICFPLYAMWIQSGTNPFVAGAMSGVVASFAATPPDVIKTRILSQDSLTQAKRRKEQPVPTTILPMAPVVLAVSNSTSAVLLTGSSSSYYSSSNSNSIYHNQEDGKNENNNSNNSRNPLVVARDIIEREGASVLFSGVSERCLGAVPRFGTTLALHDYLEHAVGQAGWLSSHVV